MDYATLSERIARLETDARRRDEYEGRTDERLEKIEALLTEIKKKFDEMSGGKKALLGLFSLLGALLGIVGSFLFGKIH